MPHLAEREREQHREGQAADAALEVDARVGEREEEHAEVDGRLDGVLKGVQRGVVAIGGHEGDDKGEGEGGVQPRVEEDDPREDAAERHVHVPLLHARHLAHADAQKEADGEHAEQACGPRPLRRVERVGVGERDDDEADKVVGDGEQQQIVDGGVAEREDAHRNHPRDGDVGGSGHAPAVHQVGQGHWYQGDVGGGAREQASMLVVRRLVDGLHLVAFKASRRPLQRDEAEVDTDGASDTADGTDE